MKNGILRLMMVMAVQLAMFSGVQATAPPTSKKKADLFSTNTQLIALLEDSEYHYIIEDYEKADSLYRRAVQLAEFTRDEDVILKTMFYNNSVNISENTTLLKKDQFVRYIQEGINAAKTFKRQDYIAYGNASLSELYRKKGDFATALKYANLAFSTALNVDDDSCKVVCGIQVGKIYQSQRDMLLAFKNYTVAHDIAIKSKNPALVSMVYHALGGLYLALDRDNQAKDYYFKSLEINEKSGNKEGIINDYIAIGSVFDYEIAIEYLEKAIKLAEEIKDKHLEKRALIYVFSHLIVRGDCSQAFDYLEKHPLVKTYYQNRGPFSYNWTKGEIYLYGNKADSAKKYFDQAATYYLVDAGYDKKSRLNFVSEYAMVYEMLGDKAKTYDLYKQAYQISQETRNLPEIKYYAEKLKDVYLERGDYENAFRYSEVFRYYKDTIETLLKEKEFATLEIDNENKRIEAEKLKADEDRNRLYNMQYMGITILTCMIFTFLLFISGKKGRFSIRFVEIIGFFAFIFLFEFIILIIDHKVHHATHGSPFLIWLIKIVVISFLLPLHHYTEGKVVHYLTTNKLVIPKDKIRLNRILDIFSLNHGHPAGGHEKEKAPEPSEASS